MANVTPGYTWASGNTVTATLLNQAVDDATVTNIVDADIDNNAAIALSKLATGALPTAITVASANIVDGTIVAADIASGAIVGSKLADASVTPAKLSQPYTLATAQNSTSGTAINFTGIPSWAKRITVMFNGVSTSGTSAIIIQLGDAGGIENSGYLANADFLEDNAAGAGFTAGFGVTNVSVAASTYHGQAVISTLGSNIWVHQSVVAAITGSTGLILGAGSKTLSEALTQLRITTVNGADTFDAGSINIAYEG